ncbi:MAG TPA: serine/threonine-protein kinase [Gemmatimonadaceae bacterium]|nr:serine/threonine-protein kinase [Gemmatimonadaceae bacterium]
MQPDAVIDGKYRIEHYVARGGVGTLFKAIDIRTTQPCALKITHEATTNRRRMTIREASLATRATHANLAKVVDHGELPDGRAYVASEWIDGVTFGAAWRSSARSIRQSLEALESISRALGALHEAGVIHRDVKPDNIIIPFDSSCLAYEWSAAKLVDFGVAAEHSTAALLSTYDSRGRTSGTPNYMAPEQLTGRRQFPETDLYAIGVVIYECIWGATPFANVERLGFRHQPWDAPVAAGPFVMSRISKDVTFPDTPEVAAELVRLVRSLLDRRIDQRPKSGVAVADAIRQLIDASTLTGTA